MHIIYRHYLHLQLHRDGHWDKLQENNKDDIIRTSYHVDYCSGTNIVHRYSLPKNFTSRMVFMASKRLSSGMVGKYITYWRMKESYSTHTQTQK